MGIREEQKNKKLTMKKPLKITYKFNDDISKEEEDRIWFRIFDILLNQNNNLTKDKNEKITHD